MNHVKTNKIKIILALAGTLIIGFALGMLTSAQIRNAHLKKYRSFSSTDRFIYGTLHMIDPTPEQKEKILPVIRKYASENNVLRERYRNDFIALMKDFKKELYPYLTDAQKERMDNIARSHVTRGAGPKRRGGPPSPPPGSHGPGRMPCPW